MTTATETTPKPVVEEIPAFQRPPVTIGMDVLWYPDYEITKSPHICTVSFSGPEVIEVVNKTTLMKHDSVRHLKDPARMTKPVLKRFGGWDYTEEYKDRIAFQNAVGKRLEAYEQRLDALEGAVLTPTPKGKKAD